MPGLAGRLCWPWRVALYMAGREQITTLETSEMPAYLKIENIGVCPPEGFTVLGVSLADTSAHQGVIGQFGSGNKHAIAVCLRSNLSPIVFAGTLKLEFSTKPQTVTDGLASKEFGRVV